MASWTAARAALATAGASSSGTWSIAWAPNEIRYWRHPRLRYPGGLLRPCLDSQTNDSPRTHRSARRNFSRVPAVRPRERHVTVFAEIIAAAADYEQSNRTSPNAAIVRSVRLCRRAEPGHLLTGTVPWQTERQPRIFDMRSASSTGPRCFARFAWRLLARLDGCWVARRTASALRTRRKPRARPCLAGPHRSPTSPRFRRAHHRKPTDETRLCGHAL